MTRKETYGHAFVLLAASTAVQAGLPAGDLLEDAAVIFDRWLWDEPACAWTPGTRAGPSWIPTGA